MNTTVNYVFKIASEDWEFDQISRLNYSTFAEEIPQHSENSAKTLVDKFHKENSYIICLNADNKIIGMVCFRDKRPFSLDAKVADLDSYLPKEKKNICEIRLLAISKEYRKGLVLKGLMTTLFEYCINKGCNIAVISGTLRQLKLYRHMGFVPFGDVVGTKEAPYQPMYLTMEKAKENLDNIFLNDKINHENTSYINLMPGPVDIEKDIQYEFSKTSISHRSDSFKKLFLRLKTNLCTLVKASNVQVFTGSGTLANDIVAGQLLLMDNPGLIISNGEFGERLIDHASRIGLSFKSLKVQWGRTFDKNEIEDILNVNKDIGWLWAVHLETSTGILNDMDMLKNICSSRKIKLCLDCVSSIGTMPINMEKVFLASGVSGKALGSYTGISFVFYNDLIKKSSKLPRYIDMSYYEEKDGIPFTISSNLIYSLDAAVEKVLKEDKYTHIKETSIFLRHELQLMGLKIINPIEFSSYSVITIELPNHIKSIEIGEDLEKQNCYISYNSEYLIKRNWVQVYIIGNTEKEKVKAFLNLLKKSKG